MITPDVLERVHERVLAMLRSRPSVWDTLTWTKVEGREITRSGVTRLGDGMHGNYSPHFHWRLYL